MNVGDLVAHLKINRDSVGPAFTQTEAEADGAGRRAGTRFGDGLLTGLRPKVDQISGVLTKLGAIPVFASMIPQALSLANALVPVSGALFALPAAATLAAGAFAALKVGTSGVGDALSALADGDAKKAAEALAKLSPEARQFVVAANGVRESMKGMQQSVQDKLFAGLAEDVKALGSTYLPTLKGGLGGIAESFNGIARSAMAAAQTPFFTGTVESILGQTAEVFDVLRTSVGDLLTVLVAAGDAGMPMVRAMASWAADGLASAAAFLQTAEGARWMQSAIDGAQAALSKLGQIVANVGTVLWSAMGASADAGFSLLDTLVQLTAQAAQWASSMQGQEQMAAIFSLLGQTAAALGPVLGIVGQAIATVVQWFTALPAPVQGVIAQFLAWSLVAGLIAPKLIGLVTGIRSVASAAGFVLGPLVTLGARWGLLGAAAQAAGATTGAGVGTILMAMTRAAAGMMARAAIMAASWLLAMGPIGWIVAAVIAVVALIIANWDKVKAFFMALPGYIGAALSWLGSVISSGASAAWDFIVSTAKAAISNAINTLLSLPGLVAYALGFLAGLVYNGALAAWRFLSETLPAAIDAALNWLAALPGRVLSFLVNLGQTIANGARDAWNWLVTTTVAVLAALPGLLRTGATNAWNAFRDATVNLATATLNFIRELPGRIRGFFADAGSWLVNAGRQIVVGLWNGLKSMAQAVLDWIRDLGARIAAGFRAAVGINSPSKIFAGYGVDLGRGLIDRKSVV